MAKMSSWFDFERLYRDVDVTRAERGLTWQQVSEQSGVSRSSIGRIRTSVSYPGRAPHKTGIDTACKLIAWAGVGLESYVIKRIDKAEHVKITQYDVANHPAVWKRYGFFADQVGGIEYVCTFWDWTYRAVIDKLYELRLYDVGSIGPFHEGSYDTMQEAVSAAYGLIAQHHNGKDLDRYVFVGSLADNANQVVIVRPLQQEIPYGDD